jgi:hypothetical protein
VLTPAAICASIVGIGGKFATEINDTSGTDGKFAAGFIDIDGKFACGVVDTGRKFASCIVDTVGKFATSVIYTNGAP